MTITFPEWLFPVCVGVTWFFLGCWFYLNVDRLWPARTTDIFGEEVDSEEPEFEPTIGEMLLHAALFPLFFVVWSFVMVEKHGSAWLKRMVKR